MEEKKFNTYFNGTNNEELINSNFSNFIKFFIRPYSKVINNYLILLL